VITLKNITKCFPVFDDNLLKNNQIRDGYFYALDDVSLNIEDGGCTIIAGANGSGKSLLVFIIAGLEEPTSGFVKTDGKAGLVFQEPDAQILGETPFEDVSFGLLNMGVSKEDRLTRAENALSETGLKEKAYFPARSLSGGEKRRLAAAGILAVNAQIIIFDEPYANMDFPGVVQVNRLLQKLIAEKKTIIILTHELEKCMALADHFIVLSKGKKVFDGTAHEALSCDLETWGINHPLERKMQNMEDLLW
jgi:biotin transport system ATP-binding protein